MSDPGMSDPRCLDAVSCSVYSFLDSGANLLEFLEDGEWLCERKGKVTNWLTGCLNGHSKPVIKQLANIVKETEVIKIVPCVCVCTHMYVCVSARGMGTVVVVLATKDIVLTWLILTQTMKTDIH